MQEKFTRRRLPHWDLPGAIYFITTCLADSIPAQGLLELARFRQSLKRQARPADVSESDWKAECWKRNFARIDDWLDLHPASRHLADPRLAAEVAASFKRFDGTRYDLIAWVVMPSHVHWLFRPRDEWVDSLGPDADRRSPRQRIQFSQNSFTGRACNNILGLTGPFWQWESYDHCVRDEEELERIVAYIHSNPVRAGLVARPQDYRFSSAFVA
jgi:type I restriction enzyme R subunit